MKKRLLYILIPTIILVLYFSSLSITAIARAPVTPASPPAPVTVPAPVPVPVKAYNITLTLPRNPVEGQVITWETSVPAKGRVQYIQYGPRAYTFKKAVIKASTDSIVKTESGTNLYFHTVTLTGLLPETKYLYRVGSGSSWSSPLTFTTMGDYSQFKFLVFGDSQSTGSYIVWRNTLQTAAKANPEARFFVNTGDLVDEGQDVTQWNYWFKAAKGVIDRIAAMPVRGNHEKNKSYWRAYFKLPDNGPADARGLSYSFDLGPVHFVMLDNTDPYEKETLTNQKEWLIRDLQASSKTWKIVFFHKPLYPNKPERDNDYLKDVYAPIFDKYHVDLVFNGHDHNIARTFPLFNGEAVKNPSGGTIYYVSGRSGTKYYKDVARISRDGFFYNPVDQPNYIVVNVNKSSVQTIVYKPDGTVIDNFVLNK